MAWWRQPIHPVFLYLRDQKLHEKFILERRENTYHRLKIGVLTFIIFFSLEAIISPSSIEKHFSIQFGGIAIICVFFLLLTKFWRCVVDYILICILISRGITTIVLFTFINEEKEGFENIDRKELIDSMIFVFLPTFSLISVNWKFDLTICVPILVITHSLCVKYSFNHDDDNLSCYKNPENVSSVLNTRWLMFLTVFIFAIYSY